MPTSRDCQLEDAASCAVDRQTAFPFHETQWKNAKQETRRAHCGHRRALTHLFLAWITCIQPSAVHAGDARISIRQLNGPLYLVEDRNYENTTNSLIYVGSSYVTVVGASWTPGTARELAGQIQRITRLPIREIIDTSPDPEWSGGNGYWKSIGANILAMQITSDLLEQTWAATVEACRKNHPTYPQVPLVLPTESHSSEFLLQNGRIRAIYLGPSHTAGDIFVYFPEEKVLDAGSILKEQLGNMAKADLKEYPNTLRKLQDLHLDIKTIIAGHWSAVHGPDLVNHYLHLLSLYTPASELNAQ